MDTIASIIIGRYAHSMISDALDFIHRMPSVAVPMKFHLDVQMTLIARLLYRLRS